MIQEVDINTDIGEGFGNYAMPNDEAIMPLVTSANIACGFHAGDPLVMNKTVALAKHIPAFRTSWDLGGGSWSSLPRRLKIISSTR